MYFSKRISTSFLSRLGMLLLSGYSLPLSASESITLQGSTTGFERNNAIIRTVFDRDSKDLAPLAKAAESLKPGEAACWSVTPKSNPDAKPQPVEVEVSADSKKISLVWVEPGKWPAGETRQWQLNTNAPVGYSSPWKWLDATDGQLELHHRDRGLVFRYVRQPVTRPGLPPTQLRGGYIHPFLTPSGKQATGDFSPNHTHHRGFFLAYAKTKRETATPDFWNIHAGTAKIVADPAKIKTRLGPVTARFSTHNAWQLRDKAKPTDNNGETVMNETWDFTIYELPGQPAWVWDLVSTQTPVGKDLELPKYRYGGMAYRGPEPFVKGKLDVMTSEGNDDRKTADQKPARWIDLTGPVEPDSTDYIGAVMCDHPSNVRHPNVVRIHPVTLPFYSWVPSHKDNLTLKAGTPYVWQYRTMVHDGRPNRLLNQSLFDDFAHPVEVQISN
jgi:hypothetical protein